MAVDLAPLASLRAEAATSEARLLARLTRFTANPALDLQWARQTAIADEERVRPVAPTVNARRAPLVAAVRMLPVFREQARRMRRDNARRCLVVSLASNRLRPAEAGDSLREYVAGISRTLPPPGASTPSKSFFSEMVHEAPCIYIVDPLPVSNLWAHRRRAWDEGVFLLDAAFLGTATLHRLARRPGPGLREAASVLRASLSTAQTGPRPAVQAYARLVGETFASLLGRFERTESLFFTSNSVVTEVLRDHQLRDPSCRELYEMMHGIASVDAERFFAAMLARGGPRVQGRKFGFVPQLPHLPAYGVFAEGPRQGGARLSVNAYLNQYFLARAGRGSFEDFVDREWARLAPREVGGEKTPLVITFLGGDSNLGRSEDSPSFRAECLLLTLIARTLTTLDRDAVLVYVPHPSQRGKMFDHPAFLDAGVQVYPESVFSWLVSDLAVSLFSSAMFEASYFGVPTFTPLVPEDGVYTEGYLRLLEHPASESMEDLVQGLDQFLRGGAAKAPEAPLTKARRRLAMTGWSWGE